MPRITPSFSELLHSVTNQIGAVVLVLFSFLFFFPESMAKGSSAGFT